MTTILITLICLTIFSFGMLIRAAIQLDVAHKEYVEERRQNRYSWHWSNK